jgi:hypothetical protein
VTSSSSQRLDLIGITQRQKAERKAKTARTRKCPASPVSAGGEKLLPQDEVVGAFDIYPYLSFKSEYATLQSL